MGEGEREREREGGRGNSVQVCVCVRSCLVAMSYMCMSCASQLYTENVMDIISSGVIKHTTPKER